VQVKPKKLVEYKDKNGKSPFKLWLNELQNQKAQVIIDARLTRVRLGNLGHCRAVGGGVLELKIDFGPGYRIYFGQDGESLVVLLVGGDKKSQASDIKKAKLYWLDYKE
jgi:putative addiction module killer protein